MGERRVPGPYDPEEMERFGDQSAMFVRDFDFAA